jgi:Protein of unknown function (DUF1688)
LSDAPGDTPAGALDRRTPFELLRHPGTIRARCRAVLDAVADDRSANFRVDRSRLDAAAERVAALTLRRFPDLKIPYHSRWRHFEAGGVDRKAELDALLAGRSVAEQARARFDLTVVSVLLDAGAGPQWRYVEDAVTYRRSEGLGVASFRAFVQGLFSAREDDPLRADGAALARVDAPLLRRVFQAGPDNPMVGLDGRAALLARLGRALAAPAAGDEARPGILYDQLTDGGRRRQVGAAEVLEAVLRVTGPAWAGGNSVMGQPVGDMWPHRFAGGALAGGHHDAVTAGVVPFHKLSQWLAYSLLEPLQWAGVEVTGLDELTGLPEYRNGGLLLDTGVVVPRDPRSARRTWKPGDEFIVEWRALTVALLDELAIKVRERLGRSADELPLACILEGGTWAAGREIAQELRGGTPPLSIESDGTVF